MHICKRGTELCEKCRRRLDEIARVERHFVGAYKILALLDLGAKFQQEDAPDEEGWIRVEHPKS